MLWPPQTGSASLETIHICVALGGYKYPSRLLGKLFLAHFPEPRVSFLKHTPFEQRCGFRHGMGFGRAGPAPASLQMSCATSTISPEVLCSVGNSPLFPSPEGHGHWLDSALGVDLGSPGTRLYSRLCRRLNLRIGLKSEWKQMHLGLSVGPEGRAKPFGKGWSELGNSVWISAGSLGPAKAWLVVAQPNTRAEVLWAYTSLQSFKGSSWAAIANWDPSTQSNGPLGGCSERIGYFQMDPC